MEDFDKEEFEVVEEPWTDYWDWELRLQGEEKGEEEGRA